MADRSTETPTLTLNGEALIDKTDRSPTYKIVANTNGLQMTGKVVVDQNQETEGNLDDPPDGGARAWLVVISAFLCNSILFGIINTYGIIYLTLQERMTSAGDTDASSKAGE